MSQVNNDDSVKRIFGKTAKELLLTPPETHSKFHNTNAFCGNAGPEEMSHFQELLDALTDNEVYGLVQNVGIAIAANADERDVLEGVLDETDRETFYREYHAILNKR